MMVLGGLLSVIGSRAIGFTSAGALGCMVLSCMCGRSWQKPYHQATQVLHASIIPIENIHFDLFRVLCGLILYVSVSLWM